MIDRSSAKKHIAALRTMPFAGQLDADAWGVMIDCLRDRAESEAHAKRIMDACLLVKDFNGAPRLVTVAEIGDIAYQSRSVEKRPDRACSHCQGCGWRQADRNGYSASVRCGCWKEQPVEDQPVYSKIDVTPTPEIAALACGKTLASGGDRE